MPFIPRRHEYRGEGWVSRRDYAARDERDEQDEQEEQESDDDDDRSALAHETVPNYIKPPAQAQPTPLAILQPVILQPVSTPLPPAPAVTPGPAFLNNAPPRPAAPTTTSLPPSAPLVIAPENPEAQVPPPEAVQTPEPEPTPGPTVPKQALEKDVAKPSASAGPANSSSPKITPGVEAVIIAVVVAMAFGILFFLIWYFVYRKSKIRKEATEAESSPAPPAPDMSVDIPRVAEPIYVPPPGPIPQRPNRDFYPDEKSPAYVSRRTTLTNNAFNNRDETLGLGQTDPFASPDDEREGNEVPLTLRRGSSVAGDNYLGNSNPNGTWAPSSPNPDIPLSPNEQWDRPAQPDNYNKSRDSIEDTDARYQTPDQWISDQSYRTRSQGSR